MSKANDQALQVAYMRQRGLQQSTYEHLLPARLLTDAVHPDEAISAVQALTIASQQGQRIYTITQDNLARILPKLQIDPDVTAEIQAAVVTGNIAMISEREITIGRWTGVGYLIVDPATGAGAYQISGGANGAIILTTLIALGTIIILAVMGGLIAATTFAFVAFFSIEVVAALSFVAHTIFFQAFKDEATFADALGLLLGTVGLIASIAAAIAGGAITGTVWALNIVSLLATAAGFAL